MSLASYFYLDKFYLWCLDKLLSKIDNPDEILKAISTEQVLVFSSKTNIKNTPVEIITPIIDPDLDPSFSEKGVTESKSKFWLYVCAGLIIIGIGSYLYFKDDISYTFGMEDIGTNGEFKEVSKELSQQLAGQYSDLALRELRVKEYSGTSFRDVKTWSEHSFFEKIRIY